MVGCWSLPQAPQLIRLVTHCDRVFSPANRVKSLYTFCDKATERRQLGEPQPYSATLALPSWLEEIGPTVKENRLTVEHPSRGQPLKNIRPFSATQLTVFNANACKLATPSRKNEIVKHLWKLRVNASYRKAQARRLVITANVVRHMLQHTTCVFNNILTSQRDLIDLLIAEQRFRSRYSRVQLVDRGILQYCLRGTTVASERVDTLAEVIIPEPSTTPNPRLVVALDNVRYPQNVANIVRTAVALNVDVLFYLTGTADPFDWKVSHVTGGLQFMLPYQKGDIRELKRYCKTHKLTPVVAHLEGESVDDIELTGGICVILSNESEGPDPKILKFAKRVTLPMHPLVNSLNVSVAGAILIHQLQERLRNSSTASNI